MTTEMRIIDKPGVVEVITSIFEQSPINKARVCILMGPNGSGKTRFLKDIQTHFKNNSVSNLFIGASRSTPQLNSPELLIPSMNGGIQTDFSSVQEVALKIIDKLFALPPVYDPGMARASFASGYMPLSYEQALNLMIDVVLRKDDEADAANINAIIQWNRYDRENGTLPPNNIPPVWPEFKNLLYDILGYDFQVAARPLIPSTTPRQISYNLNGERLTTHNLSDGEKQIMLMSILMLVSIDRKLVIFVDEPELHLNEQKAIDVWSKVERSLPESLFVYSTHSVAFATRSEVESLHFMRMDGQIEWMDLQVPIPSHALKEIVGSRVQLLKTDKPVIFCEDELSKNIIVDLFKLNDFVVISVGGKDGVIRGARPDDIWNKLIAGDRRCCGIIDRDAMQPDQVETLRSRNSFCLPVNETESLLLHPDIILSLVKAVNPDSTLTEEAYARIVCGCARSELNASLDTLQGYIVNKTRVKIVHKQGSAGIEIESLSGPDEIKENFLVYANKLLDAIKSNDLETVLLLSCGKEVFERIARDSVSKIGIAIDPDPIRFYNMIRDKPLVTNKLNSIYGMDILIGDVIDILS